MSRTVVLYVEDSDADARLVESCLQSDGGFDVRRAKTLAEASSELSKAGAPDVILLDLILPDSSGLETFANFQSRFSDIPIVILSGQDDEQMAVDAVNQGAQDYLPKSEAATKTLTRSLRYAIERQRRMKAERQVERTSEDVELARRIQRKLLPSQPPQIKGFDVAGRCVPAEATGGDLFDFVPLPDGRCDFVVADVSSHGFAPALIMAGIRRLLLTIASHHEDVAEILTLANQAMVEDTLEDQFVTMFYGRLDPHTRMMQYTAAGHPVFHLDTRGTASALNNPYLPLGIVDDPMTESFTKTLQPGDILLLMTDGIWEAQAADRSLFGRERVYDLVRQNRKKPAQQIVDMIFAAIADFCRPRQHADDLTLVIVKTIERE